MLKISHTISRPQGTTTETYQSELKHETG